MTLFYVFSFTIKFVDGVQGYLTFNEDVFITICYIVYIFHQFLTHFKKYKRFFVCNFSPFEGEEVFLRNK